MGSVDAALYNNAFAGRAKLTPGCRNARTHPKEWEQTPAAPAAEAAWLAPSSRPEVTPADTPPGTWPMAFNIALCSNIIHKLRYHRSGRCSHNYHFANLFLAGMLNDSLSVCRVVPLHQGPDGSRGAEDPVSWHSSPGAFRNALTPDQTAYHAGREHSTHSDNDFHRHVLEGIKRGLQVGFDHATPLVSSRPNMPSAAS